MRYPRALPVGVFALTMAITLLAVLGIERAEAERATTQTRAVSGAIASALERRSFAHIAYLRAAAILLAEPGRINLAHFHDFAGDLDTDEENRGGEGITWAARVPVAAIPAFEAERRADGDVGYTIHPAPAPGQTVVVPVTFMGRPTPENRIAMGYDTYSDGTRREAMDMAAKLGRPVASGRLELVRPRLGHRWSGFIIYMPVFAIIHGQRQLAGFVFTPFNAQTFLASALDLAGAPDLGVRLYDGAVEPDRLLAGTDARQGEQPVVATPLAVAERRMVLVVRAAAPNGLSSLSQLTLIAGMLVAALLMVLARLVTQQAATDRASLDWLREQVSIRNSLTRELNHRVKNTLANVLSIIALTRRRVNDLDTFVESLKGRIRALSATHDLLTRRDWGPTPVSAVIAAELAPYAEGHDHVVDLSGPDVELAPNDALSLGLAIHELATNASKYGALSVLEGRVIVRWQLVAPDRARISWQEQGGPPVRREHPRGFGMELLEKIVAHELGEPVDLDFAVDGVRCALVVPVRLPVAFQIRARAAPGQR